MHSDSMLSSWSKSETVQSYLPHLWLKSDWASTGGVCYKMDDMPSDTSLSVVTFERLIYEFCVHSTCGNVVVF